MRANKNNGNVLGLERNCFVAVTAHQRRAASVKIFHNLVCKVSTHTHDTKNMSKLSFRARALDASKPMPIFMAEELPDLPDYSAINRAVPQMPTGMQKEEECVSFFPKKIHGNAYTEVSQLEDAILFGALNAQ